MGGAPGVGGRGGEMSVSAMAGLAPVIGLLMEAMRKRVSAAWRLQRALSCDQLHTLERENTNASAHDYAHQDTTAHSLQLSAHHSRTPRYYAALPPSAVSKWQ